jgi:hypothetical protein
MRPVRQALLEKSVRDASGITLVEVAIVVALMGFLLAHVLTLSTSLKQRSITASRQIDVETRARPVMDKLMERLRMIGAHVPGPQAPDPLPTPGTPTPTPGPGLKSQFAILWAQPYDLLYNSNISDDRQAVPGNTVLPPGLTVSVSQTLSAHQAPTLYVASATPTPGAVERARAETCRISLDAGDEDGVITGDDKRGSAAPRAILQSQNPSDYALIEQCWYSTDHSTLQTAERTVFAVGVRAWTEAADTYPNGERPPPLFSYWLDERVLNEDFDANGSATNVLLFGDEDGDLQLGQAEIAALLTENPLGGIGRAVSEAGSGVDSRFSAWRTAISATHSNERIARILNRSIVRIQVQLRLESANAEPGIYSPFSSGVTPYRYRHSTMTATATLYDLVYAYPHTALYY